MKQKIDSENELDGQVLKYIAKHGATSVEELYYALHVGDRLLTKAELTETVWRIARQGRVDLDDIPPTVHSLGEYLSRWERNLWLYGSLAVLLVTMFAIFGLPSTFPLLAVRWVFGSVFAIFVPGYVAIEALYPRSNELSPFARFVLSIGLSLTLVPLVGLLLNFTPWRITLMPVIISLVILTIGLIGLAFVRQYYATRKRAA